MTAATMAITKMPPNSKTYAHQGHELLLLPVELEEVIEELLTFPGVEPVVPVPPIDPPVAPDADPDPDPDPEPEPDPMILVGAGHEIFCCHCPKEI